MQKPWRACEEYEFEPIQLDALAAPIRDFLFSYTIEFVSLGFIHAGDYRLNCDGNQQTLRFFQSSDGAVLGWVADDGEDRQTFQFGSILSDGTFVRSTPDRPSAPWNCCRFPVHVNFGADNVRSDPSRSGCGLEELLVLHLTSLAELEHGCGPTIKYEPAQLTDVFYYMQMLVHETLHGRGAPVTALPIPQAEPVGELAAR